MVGSARTSAVVVRVAVPPSLERLRRRWDWAAGVGVPAHVTVLFPFLPVELLLTPVRADLAAIATNEEPFEVRFERVGRFPNVVYLAPEPAAPFRRLTDAVVSRFPGYPPYEGAFDTVIHHLTIVEGASRPLDEIAAEAEQSLPFTHLVRAVETLIEGDDGRWHQHWRIPLGVRR
jgi:2'-5' RNA ligase